MKLSLLNIISNCTAKQSGQVGSSFPSKHSQTSPGLFSWPL